MNFLKGLMTNQDTPATLSVKTSERADLRGTYDQNIPQNKII